MVTDVTEGGKQSSLKAFAAEYEARIREVAQREGTLPCTEVGCDATTAVGCEYVDRRSRACRTAWCPTHRMLVEDHVYCRRHAGVVSALPAADSSLVVPLPDLENRAPSLVGWVSRQIDADVWRLLLGELDNRTGGQLIADPVVLVFTGMQRSRAWERAWKLLTHAGVNVRVSLIVEEAADDEVIVKVGTTVAARLVPPWITHRKNGEHIDDEQDSRERAQFNEQVLQAIGREVRRQRELDAAGGGPA